MSAFLGKSSQLIGQIIFMANSVVYFDPNNLTKNTLLNINTQTLYGGGGGEGVLCTIRDMQKSFGQILKIISFV